MAVSFDFTNEVFASFAFYSTLLILKVFIVALMTGVARRRKVFCSQEDVNFFHYDKKKVKSLGVKPVYDDEKVNRVKRIHLNDLENIPAFILLSILYVLTDPSSVVAINHFRIFAISRFLHTVVYKFALPQPTRGICYIVGLVACISMAVQILIATFQ